MSTVEDAAIASTRGDKQEFGVNALLKGERRSLAPQPEEDRRESHSSDIGGGRGDKNTVIVAGKCPHPGFYIGCYGGSFIDQA